MKLTEARARSLLLQKLVFEELEGGEKPPVRTSDQIAASIFRDHKDVTRAIKANKAIGWSDLGNGRLAAWREE